MNPYYPTLAVGYSQNPMLSSCSIHTIPRTLKKCPSFPMGSRKNPTLHGVDDAVVIGERASKEALRAMGIGASLVNHSAPHAIANFWLYRIITSFSEAQMPDCRCIPWIVPLMLSSTTSYPIKIYWTCTTKWFSTFFQFFQVFGIVFLLPSDQANAVSSPCAFGLSGPCDGACRRFWGNWCAIGRFSMGLVESLKSQPTISRPDLGGCRSILW